MVIWLQSHIVLHHCERLSAVEKCGGGSAARPIELLSVVLSLYLLESDSFMTPHHRLPALFTVFAVPYLPRFVT